MSLDTTPASVLLARATVPELLEFAAEIEAEDQPTFARLWDEFNRRILNAFRWGFR